MRWGQATSFQMPRPPRAVTETMLGVLPFLPPPPHAFVCASSASRSARACGVSAGRQPLLPAGESGDVFKAVFLLRSVSGSLLEPVLAGQVRASTGLTLSSDCRPAAEPEGADHLPGRGARAGPHPLGAVGQRHHGPATPGEAGLPLGQPPAEHLKLHQQILDLPGAGGTWGPHARHLLLW